MLAPSASNSSLFSSPHPGGTAEVSGAEPAKVPLSMPRWVLVLC